MGIDLGYIHIYADSGENKYILEVHRDRAWGHMRVFILQKCYLKVTQFPREENVLNANIDSSKVKEK